MASAMHVSLELKVEKDSEAVHYKHDGERFPDGQENTVKLNVDCPYVFTITVRPARTLTHWMIRGEKVEFERRLAPKEEEDVSLYETHWSSTGMEVTKRGERYSMPMVLEMHPGLIMKIDLQTKFYPASETVHRKWGPEVHSVECKCEIPEGLMHVNVVHQKII